MITDEKNNTGHYNTGSRNAGHYNTGHYNTGHYNTGHYNTGNCNAGYHNTGHCNAGYHNTGHYNTGHYNTGNRNTGDYNTGDYNTGNRNTGDYNTGDYNTGDYHVGCFNTTCAEKAYYFNQLIDKNVWDNARKPSWIYDLRPTTWVPSGDMTPQEKADNPRHKTTGGYLRVNDIKEEWRKAYNNAKPEDIELTKALPAFDADVFLEITGIDLREPKKVSCEGREIEIDGVTYILTEKK